jgi:hypothetical protein
MKKISMGIAGLMLLGIMAYSSSDDGIPFIPGPAASGISLPQTGQNVCFDMAGNTTACGTGIDPGQDGDLAKGVEWRDPRFDGSGRGVVMDRLTDLMWVKDG